MEAKTLRPSADPRIASLDRSGCGIIPRTFRFALQNSRNIAERAVGIGFGGNLPVWSGVTEGDAVLGLEPRSSSGVQK